MIAFIALVINAVIMQRF